MIDSFEGMNDKLFGKNNYLKWKQIITILFIGLISFSINAQDKTAKISFKSDTIDYGTVEKGADGLRVFEFTNTGDAPLIVSRVTSSCGCTVPKWSKDPIMPGAKGTIEVSYDTKRLGGFSKALTVYSNAKTERKMLKIKGNISKDAGPAKAESIVSE